MAVPKQKTTKKRQGNRRAHHSLTTPHISVCAKCKAPVRPHFACMECGYYGKKKVVGGKPAMAMKPAAPTEKVATKETEKTPAKAAK